MAQLEAFAPYIDRFFDLFMKPAAVLGARTLIPAVATFMDSHIEPVASSASIPLPYIKVVLSLLVSYPLAFVFRKVPSGGAKHVFSAAVGVALMQWVYGIDWAHSFITSMLTYVLCIVCPRSIVPYVVFFAIMGYLVTCHAYTIWASDITKFDHTGTQMVITMKLTSFAYNLYDGTFDRKRVFETTYEDKRKARVFAGRKRFAVEGIPSLLEFLGYVYCFPSMIAGPAFEYADYKRSLSGVVFNLKGAIVPPSNATLLSLKKLAIGLFFLVLHLAVGQFAHYDTIHDPTFIATHSIAYRLGYTLLLLYQIRFKYYFLWKVSEGACIMAHLGFEGYDAEGKALGWGEVDNIDIYATETASSLQGLSRAWNKRTQGWLERYTYNRSGNNLMLVYFVSAIWHGLYAGYFIFFLTIALASMVERLAQAKLNPIFIPNYDGKSDASAGNGIVGFLYWNIGRLCQMFTMTYCTISFALHKWEKVYRVYQSYHHAYHIALVVAFIVLTVMPSKKVKKDKAA